MPARFVPSRPRRVLKISPHWASKKAFLTCWQRLCRARTGLTSTISPSKTKGAAPGAVGAGARPGTPGSTTRPRAENQTDTTTETRAPAQSVTVPREP